jgi:hypothetical protein
MDKKGFLISIIQKSRRIIPVKQLRKTIGALQDRSREFITLITYISAAGRRLPPLIIFGSQSRDIQASWISDIELDNPVQRSYFATSETGWSSDIHRLN